MHQFVKVSTAKYLEKRNSHKRLVANIYARYYDGKDGLCYGAVDFIYTVCPDLRYTPFTLL